MARWRFEPLLCGLALAACAELGSPAGDPADGAASGDPPDAASQRSKPDPSEPDAASAADAATSDASATEPDAGSDAPLGDGLGCAGHADALLCEDFESGSLDPEIWTEKIYKTGKLSIANDFGREGQRALRIVLPAAEGAGAMIRTKAPFPLSPNHFFGRAWFYAGPAIPDVHSYLIAARGQLDGGTAKYGLDCNSGKLNSRYTHPSITEHGGLKKLSYPMPADAWLCVEWEYDGEENELRYWFDGELAPALTVTAAEDPPWVAPPAFTEIDLGWYTYQQQTNASELEVFLDAIVLDDQRIGCGGG